MKSTFSYDTLDRLIGLDYENSAGSDIATPFAWTFDDLSTPGLPVLGGTSAYDYDPTGVGCVELATFNVIMPDTVTASAGTPRRKLATPRWNTGTGVPALAANRLDGATRIVARFVTPYHYLGGR